MTVPFIFYSPKHKDYVLKKEIEDDKFVNCPEKPERIESIRKAISSLGEIKEIIPWRVNTNDLKLHSYAKFLEAKCKEIPPNKEIFPDVFIKDRCLDTSTPLKNNSWQTALISLNLALNALDSVLKGKTNVAYALCRPPGHHATPDYYGGYCLINNVAVCAKRLMRKKMKIVIFDIDFHHGNGTQEIFYNTDKVFYISIHGHPDYTYPYISGYKDEIGTRKGRGFNLNYPVKKKETRENIMEYLIDIHQKIERYSPDIILISCGYDFHYKDVYSYLPLDESFYYAIGKMLTTFKCPKVIVQEGGYNPRIIGKCAKEFLKGIKNI